MIAVPGAVPSRSSDRLACHWLAEAYPPGGSPSDSGDRRLTRAVRDCFLRCLRVVLRCAFSPTFGAAADRPVGLRRGVLADDRGGHAVVAHAPSGRECSCRHETRACCRCAAGRGSAAANGRSWPRPQARTRTVEVAPLDRPALRPPVRRQPDRLPMCPGRTIPCKPLDPGRRPARHTPSGREGGVEPGRPTPANPGTASSSPSTSRTGHARNVRASIEYIGAPGPDGRRRQPASRGVLSSLATDAGDDVLPLHPHRPE
jgi:hypothetical protein